MKPKPKNIAKTIKTNTQSDLFEKSEERFHSAFENMLEGVQMLDHDWRYLYLNHAAEVHNRRPNQELLGNRYMDMWPGIEETHVFSVIKHCLQDRVSAQWENRFVYPNGKVGWFHLSIQPIPEGVLILSFDITQRVQAEVQSTQMKRLYAALSQVNQTIVRVKDQHELFETICRVAVEFGEFPLAWIGLLDHESGEMSPVAVHARGQNKLPFQSINIKERPYNEGLIGLSLQSGLVQFSNDIQVDPRMEYWREIAVKGDYHSAATIPIQKNGQIVGVLNLYATDMDFFQAQEEQSLLKEMGMDISFALDTQEAEAKRKQTEETLRENEERFRAFLTASSDVVYQMSPNWREMRQLEGRNFIADTNAPSGTWLQEYIHPDDQSHVMAVINEAIQNRSTFELEHRVRRVDGSWGWTFSRAIPRYDANGEIVEWFGAASNITERRQAQENLLASEVRYRRLFESAKDGILILDAETGTIVDVNPFLILLLGYSKETFLGKNIWELGFFRDVLANMANFLELQRTEYIRYEDLPLETADGRRINVEFVSNVYEVDHQKVIQCNIRDITERKRAEEKIQRQVQRLNGLRAIDTAISSSFDINVTLDIVLQQVLSLLGVDATAILLFNTQEKTIEYAASRGFHSNVLHQIQLKMSEGYAGRALREHKMIHIPALLQAGGKLAEALRSANEDFVDYYGTPLISKEGIQGVLEIYHRVPLNPDPEWLDFLETLAGQAAIAVDNSQMFESLQRSNAELEKRVMDRTAELNHTNSELERANHARDEFLAAMSHELRTPLNSILGLSESLLEARRGSLNKHQQISLQIIEASGHHLLDLINDILDLSKIEAGKLDYYPQPVSLDVLCRSSLAFIKAQAVKKSIAVIYDNQATLEEIDADPRRLKQILVNLLTNAIKFTPDHGTVTLQVNTQLEQEIIQFSVIDTGIGIALEDMQKLFQPFVQVDSTLNRQYEGTGLGLSLVQKLTDLHGGSVQLESEVGKGSRFTIRIPCRQDETPQSQKSKAHFDLPEDTPAEQARISAEDSTKRKMILLAEDNVANVLTIGEYIESYGYNVAVAHNGLEAIEMAESLNPDIFLMDIQMPVMNGLDAIARLRADPRFATTPIIALTALAMPGDRERCLSAGANEYMSKPVSLKALLRTVETMLRTGKGTTK